MHAQGLYRSRSIAYGMRGNTEPNGENQAFALSIECRKCSIWLFTNSGLSTFELCPARGTHTRGIPSTSFHFLLNGRTSPALSRSPQSKRAGQSMSYDLHASIASASMRYP